MGAVDGGLRSTARRVTRRGRRAARLGSRAAGIDVFLPGGAAPAPPWAARDADPDYGRPASPGWREVDWGRHLRDTEVQGRKVRYVDVGAGDAPPVVLVHGLAGSWQNWLENIPAMARGRRVLAPDLPGFGRSEMLEEVSISGYASWIEEWLDGLGTGPVVVVGNSMGGFISAELAIVSPERVERLALVAAAGISITSLKRRPALTVARLSAAVGAAAASRSHDVVARRRLRHLILATVFRHPSRICPDLLFEILGGSGSPAYQHAFEALLSYDFRDRLGEIRCPTLIVWGREDALVPVRDAETFERLIPHSRQVVMDDTGHVPMLERPDQFNRCLIEFLEEPAPTAGDEGRAEDRRRRESPAPVGPTAQ